MLRHRRFNQRVLDELRRRNGDEVCKERMRGLAEGTGLWAVPSRDRGGRDECVLGQLRWNRNELCDERMQWLADDARLRTGRTRKYSRGRGERLLDEHGQRDRNDVRDERMQRLADDAGFITGGSQWYSR